MKRIALIALLFAACSTEAGDGAGFEDFEADDLATGEDAVAAVACPGAGDPSAAICADLEPASAARARIGLNSTGSLALAQPFVAPRAGLPGRVMLRLRQLRPGSSGTLRVELRSVADGAPAGEAGAFAFAELALSALGSGAAQHTFTLEQSAPASPVPLVQGTTYALVVRVTGDVGSSTALVGVTSSVSSGPQLALQRQGLRPPATSAAWIAGTGALSYAITIGDGVLPNANPVISWDGTLPGATAGVAYSATIPAASDSDGDALTYTAEGLSAWLSFDGGTRTLSGTPVAEGTATGTLVVTDGRGGTASRSFSVAIAPPLQLVHHFDASVASSVVLTSGKVSAWNAIVGSTNLVQSLAVHRPTYETGAYPGVRFASASDTHLVTSPQIAFAGEFTRFFVVKFDSYLGTPMFLGGGAAGNNTKEGYAGTSPSWLMRLFDASVNESRSPPVAAGAPTIYGISRDAQDKVDATFNGSSDLRLFSDAAQSGLTRIDTIGAAAPSFQMLTGNIHEIRFYGRALSAGEKAAVSAELKAKWGIP